MTTRGVYQFNKFTKTLHNFKDLFKTHQGEETKTKVSAFEGSYAFPKHAVMKEKNMGSILHLVRKGSGGSKQLSTIQWESGLRGGPDTRLNKRPKKIKANFPNRAKLAPNSTRN